MAISSAVMQALLDAGATPEMLVRAAEAEERRQEQKEQAKRDMARSRKQRQRQRTRNQDNVTHVTRDVGDMRDTKSRKSAIKQPDIDKEFEAEFWPLVPVKKAKGQAVKAYRSARKRADKDAIHDGIKRYADEKRGTDPSYIKHPATWLNADGWLDEAALSTRHIDQEKIRKESGPYGRPDSDSDRIGDSIRRAARDYGFAQN